MIDDLSQTPEEFWYNNLAKYQQRDNGAGFPQNLCVVSFMKTSNKEIAVYKGSLKNGDTIVVTNPTSNHVVNNFIGIGINEREILAELNVQVYELDYNQPMTDDFVFNLLTESHGWDIKDYGDLSGY